MSKTRLILLLIICFSLFTKIISLLVNKSLLLDEAIVWKVSNLSAKNILLGKFYEYRFHGPLFYLIIHFWAKINQHELWLRIPSALFGILTVFILYLLVKKIFNAKTGLLASFFFATSSYHSYWSTQLRLYEGLIFISILYILLSLNIKRGSIGHVIVLSVLAIIGISFDLSFIWIFLVINLNMILWLCKKRINYQKWFLSILVAIPLFLYYLIHLVTLFRLGSSALRFTFTANIFNFFKLLTYYISIHYLVFNPKNEYLQFYVYLVCSLTILIIIFIQLFKRNLIDDNNFLIFTLIFFPLILSFSFSQFYPIFIHYNLIIVSIGIILLLSTLKKRLLTCLAILWLVSNIGSYSYFLYSPSLEDWKNVMPLLKTNYSDSKLLFYPLYFEIPFSYYNKIYNFGLEQNTFREINSESKKITLVARKWDTHYYLLETCLKNIHIIHSTRISGIELFELSQEDVIHHPCLVFAG